MFRALILFIIVAVSGVAQISFPGSGGGIGFPGQRRNSRGNPNDPNDPNNQNNPNGRQFPGGRRGGNQSNQQPAQTMDGMVRSITASQLVLESDDKLVTTVGLAGTTKYFRINGDAGKRDDFSAGDHVSVDAIQDDRSNFKALRVKLVKLGTAEDRSAASSSPMSSNSSIDDDRDRPRLRRATSPDVVEPQITRGDPTIYDRPVVADNKPAAAPDPDDPGRPVLRRGGAARQRTSDSVPATAPVETPSVPAASATVASVRRPSVLSSSTADRDTVIEQAREAALSFSETLPNYVVKQLTTRYVTEAARGGGKTSWNALDTITADVVAENGTESYKNIMVNGKVPRENPEKSGAWSSGEFSSMLLDVLSPVTDADFHGKRTSTISNRAAYRYDYTVEQPNSHWHVTASAQSYIPGYSGSIWIDKETFRVLRIEMSATNMPRTFELDTVESAVDYDNVLIGDRKFLVPVHSEVMNCQRGTGNCSRNVIEFRNYKKFGADTSITFDPTQ